MALTDTQRLDVRRWLGWPALLVAGQGDYVLAQAGLSTITLEARLDALTAAEEEFVTTRLTQIQSLDDGVLASADGMDTSEAGPWIANPLEVPQRVALRDRWRRDLADFLGVDPGPNLRSSTSMRIVRA